MAERQAPFAPEVRWKYSNLAYSIAGMVVETRQRPDVGRLRPAPHLRSARHERVERRQERRRHGRRLRPAHAGRHARGQPVHRCAGHGRGHGPHVDGRGHGELRVGAVPKGTAWRRADPEHGLAARDAPRPRAREQLDAGQRHRLRRAQSGRQGVRVARRQLSRLPDQHDALARRQSRRHRPDQRRRWNPGGDRDGADEHRGRRPSRRPRRRRRRR